MHHFLPFILLCIASVAAFADTPAVHVHTVAADGSHRPQGFPNASPHVLALGGKPVRVVWKDPSAAAPVEASIDRITDTRRIPLQTATATANDGEWSLGWTPPVTHGAVTYEIVLKKEGISPMRIEVRDPAAFQDQINSLKAMDWDASGLDRSEADALSALGIRLRVTSTAGNQAPPVLRMTPSDPTQSRRNVTWDQDRHDLVVWRFGPGPGDADIRAPRWWISAEALASDEGRIRFLDLFANSPVSH